MTTGHLAYTADQIRSLLPHRHPFVLLDRIERIVPRSSGVGVKNISISDPVFAAHFPQMAIYPGVLLIEAVGHTCGLVHLARGGADDDAPAGSPAVRFLAGVRKFSFVQPVVPGDVVEFHVQFRAEHAALFEYQARVMVGSRLVAQGSLAIAMQDFELDHGS